MTPDEFTSELPRLITESWISGIIMGVKLMWPYLLIGLLFVFLVKKADSAIKRAIKEKKQAKNNDSENKSQ